MLSTMVLCIYFLKSKIPKIIYRGPIFYGRLLNPDSPLQPRCVPALEASIKEVDAAYDSCNEAWARGEADKFRSTTFLT